MFETSLTSIAVSVPSRARAEPYLGGHLVAGGGADELLLPCELPFYRPAGFQCGEHAKIFGQHLLLAAKPATDPLGEHMHVPRAKTEDVTELLLGDERRLRTGADMNAPIRRGPGNRAVRLEMDVLHAGGGVDALMNDIGSGETLRGTADLAVDVGIDITVGGAPLLVQQRSFRAHRRLRVEHGGQDFILHFEQAGRPLPPRFRFQRRPQRRADRRSGRQLSST